jgi:predicted dehydrogenase
MMIRFGVVGTGWRTEFFLRVAQARPDLFACVGVVTRDIARRQAWAEPFGVTLYDSLHDLLAQNPLYVITSVTWDANPEIMHQLADEGMPVLSETPPARSVDELNGLYERVQQGAKFAVAEQYHLQPIHATRLAIANSGILGEISQAQVSIAHGYHGVSLIRRLLGVMYENCTIHGTSFVSPIVKSPSRQGEADREEIVESEQTIAYLNFGDKLGVFDFTGDQYRSHVRNLRVMVRGERGELIDNTVTYLLDHQTPIEMKLKRYFAGENGNIDGFYLRGIQVGEQWMYKNELAPARLLDDEIAVGQCMLKMADYARGGEAFYSLAEACQDRYLNIMIEEAVRTGQDVRTETQLWAT